MVGSSTTISMLARGSTSVAISLDSKILENGEDGLSELVESWGKLADSAGFISGMLSRMLGVLNGTDARLPLVDSVTISFSNLGDVGSLLTTSLMMMLSRC